jgi:peptide/nickel transport system substrate-binding protein
MAAGDTPSFEPLRLDRRQVLRGLGIGGAALAMPGLLAACSSGSGAAPGVTSSAPASVSTKQIASLSWALPTSTIVGLDIASAFDSNAQQVQILGLEGLLAVSDQLALEPLLATSWTYDPANLKYVFQIRPGVKFWDGSTMTPQDVVFSLTRHINPKVSSQIAGYFTNVADYSQTGQNEVTIHLKAPDPLVQHALVFAPILSEAFVTKMRSELGTPGSGLRIMGTGPYQITSFPDSTSATVDRFEGYWGSRPVVKSCSFTCIADTQTLRLAVQSGQSSGTFGVPVQQAASWQQLSNVRVNSAPGMFVAFLSFDLTEAPWSDIHVRRAIAYACDREGYVRAFLDGNGTPADCVVPPQQWGSVLPPAQVGRLYSQLPSYPYNLDMARKELAQSAFPHGFTTNNVIVPNNWPAVVQTLESLSTTVKQLGINMPVQQVPENDWLANLYGHKNLGLVTVLFLPDYADPADYMNLIYPSANAVKNNFNLANFKDPAVDKLLQQASSAASDTQRASYLSQVLTISQQQLPYFGLFWQNDLMAIQDTYVYEGFTGLYYNQNWLTHVFAAA